MLTLAAIDKERCEINSQQQTILMEKTIRFHLQCRVHIDKQDLLRRDVHGKRPACATQICSWGGEFFPNAGRHKGVHENVLAMLSSVMNLSHQPVCSCLPKEPMSYVV